MLPFPDEPEVPATQRATAQVPIRYEDVCQDGRLVLTAVPHAIGAVVWQKRLADHPVSKVLIRQGVVPILTRLWIEAGGGPLSVRRPLEAEGGFQLAHTVDERGEVTRIILNTFVSLWGIAGRTYGPPPPNAGARIPVGRCRGENVFTRLFAPPHERKVLHLPGVESSGLAPVPPDRYVWHPPDEVIELPEGAEPLDDALLPDDAPIVFGLAHTDSNQHVNSLVYPRLFEDAALRRLAARGRGGALLGRSVEVAYRKPCFAGDRMRIHLRAFTGRDGSVGAVGVFLPEGAPPHFRPHCFARIVLTP